MCGIPSRGPAVAGDWRGPMAISACRLHLPQGRPWSFRWRPAQCGWSATPLGRCGLPRPVPWPKRAGAKHATTSSCTTAASSCTTAASSCTTADSSCPTAVSSCRIVMPMHAPGTFGHCAGPAGHPKVTLGAAIDYSRLSAIGRRGIPALSVIATGRPGITQWGRTRLRARSRGTAIRRGPWFPGDGLCPCGPRANHRPRGNGRYCIGRGGAAGVDSRHITDLRHDHVCFIPVLATKIGDMSFPWSCNWVALCGATGFRATWAMPAATRSNGAGTVGSRPLPVALLPLFARKG